MGHYNLRPKDDFWVPVAIKKLKCLYSSSDSTETTLNVRDVQFPALWNRYLLLFFLLLLDAETRGNHLARTQQ